MQTRTEKTDVDKEEAAAAAAAAATTAAATAAAATAAAATAGRLNRQNRIKNYCFPFRFRNSAVGRYDGGKERFLLT